MLNRNSHNKMQDFYILPKIYFGTLVVKYTNGIEFNLTFYHLPDIEFSSISYVNVTNFKRIINILQ